VVAVFDFRIFTALHSAAAEETERLICQTRNIFLAEAAHRPITSVARITDDRARVSGVTSARLLLGGFVAVWNHFVNTGIGRALERCEIASFGIAGSGPTGAAVMGITLIALDFARIARAAAAWSIFSSNGTITVRNCEVGALLCFALLILSVAQITVAWLVTLLMIVGCASDIIGIAVQHRFARLTGRQRPILPVGFAICRLMPMEVE
jgi:hypothetical protein